MVTKHENCLLHGCNNFMNEKYVYLKLIDFSYKKSEYSKINLENKNISNYLLFIYF